MLQRLVEQLAGGNVLSDEQVSLAVGHLVDEQVSTGSKADFLAALSDKGETIGEIAAFARELRAKSVQPPLDAETRSREILDVCGTGGDRLGTFNISTTVAIIAAAAGVTVAKHGNRAITSQAGSADVLEALGVRIDLGPDEAARWLREHHFAFFFAPHYHPAFKNIAPARRLCAERGQRTIFNFLGPLLNPARPSAQLVGVPRAGLCEPLARVLQSLGVRRGMVVSGGVAPLRRVVPAESGQTDGLGKVRVLDGRGQSQLLSVSEALSLAQQRHSALVEMTALATPPLCGLVALAELERAGPNDRQPERFLDELSLLGHNTIAEFYQERGLSTSLLSPESFPFQFATLTELLGGDRKANAETVRRLLSGEERGPKREAVLLNAGAALLVAGRARSIAEGWDWAAELIDSGRADTKLKELVAASAAQA